MFLRCATLYLLVGISTGYRQYQDQIPNGDQVPHPCKPNFVWRGVGHMNVLGGGPRNPFGEDFEKEGKTWSPALCMMDSDGDGRTNGQELGDPDCVWTEASDQFPSRTSNITHPGVCDPWGSDACAEKNADISCSTGEYICPAVQEPHVRNLTLRIPRTKVPAEATSYMCMSFDIEFPEEFGPDQEFHIIGTQPIIDNTNVNHHIIVYSCNKGATKVTEPTPCYMSQQGCFNPLGLWTLGMAGECMYKDAGYKVGGGKKLTIMLQHHWTNPDRHTDYYDESGMTLYYTPQLRKYNAGVIVLGEQKLEIQPGQSRAVYTSTCKAKCTNKMITEKVYVASTLNHMHYLGVEQNVELFRDGEKVRDLARDDVYSYDNPILHTYESPQVVLPGDELLTTCVYRSNNRKRTTLYGEGTYDEMCFSLLTVFPKENMTGITCITWGELDMCTEEDQWIGECHRWGYIFGFDMVGKQQRQEVLDSCNYYGKCRAECPAALAKANSHPCMKGIARDYITWFLAMSKITEDAQFLAALTSCGCHEEQTVVGSRAEVSTGHVMVVMVTLLLGLCVKH